MTAFGTKASLWLPCKPKSAESESLVDKIPTVSALPAVYKEQLAQALTPVTFKKGDYLMKEGETGDVMYFIRSGEVVCQEDQNKSKRGPKNILNGAADDVNDARVESRRNTRVVATRKAGDYIGEGALITSEKRNADVIANADVVECLALSRTDFEKYMLPLKELMDHKFLCKIIKSVPGWGEIMTSLKDDELLELVSALEEAKFDKGDFIVHQGEKGDLFYIIKEGEVVCTGDDDATGQAQVFATLIRGDYFGEGAILSGEPRRCSVVVASDTASCWTLSRDSFDTLLSNDLKDALGKSFTARKQTGVAKRADVDWTDMQKIKTLGSGSYGTVDLMRNKVTGETYALKRIRKATVIQKKQKFLKNERELLDIVSSPFIVNLIRTFNEGDSVYMLTEEFALAASFTRS